MGGGLAEQRALDAGRQRRRRSRRAERRRLFARLSPSDRDHGVAQARALDERRAQGAPIGPLHGVPVAIKDIIDTADYPTECGSAYLAGRRPREDATVVARLRAAGAGIIGKTVTTEFAYFSPGKTRNPHNL